MAQDKEYIQVVFCVKTLSVLFFFYYYCLIIIFFYYFTVVCSARLVQFNINN